MAAIGPSASVTPAFATTICSATGVATSRAKAAASVTSHFTAVACNPSRIRASAAAMQVLSSDDRITAAPASASARAVASPIPREAPVTSAVCPANETSGVMGVGPRARCPVCRGTGCPPGQARP